MNTQLENNQAQDGVGETDTITPDGVDALKWREWIKPIVLEMDKIGKTEFTIIKNGGEVFLDIR